MKEYRVYNYRNKAEGVLVDAPVAKGVEFDDGQCVSCWPGSIQVFVGRTAMLHVHEDLGGRKVLWVKPEVEVPQWTKPEAEKPKAKPMNDNDDWVGAVRTAVAAIRAALFGA